MKTVITISAFLFDMKHEDVTWEYKIQYDEQNRKFLLKKGFVNNYIDGTTELHTTQTYNYLREAIRGCLIHLTSSERQLYLYPQMNSTIVSKKIDVMISKIYGLLNQGIDILTICGNPTKYVSNKGNLNVGEYHLVLHQELIK
jgi:hypothetical protein